MALPDIVLKKNQILLYQDLYYSFNIGMVNNANMFVTVVAVNDLSNQYSIGDIVLFNPSEASIILFDTKSYFLTTEDKIIFTCK